MSTHMSSSLDCQITAAEIKKDGIGRCSAVKALGGDYSIRRLETYVAIANICRASGMQVEELGALRRAIRTFGPRGLDELAARIQQLHPEAGPPECETGWGVIGHDRDPGAFKAILGVDKVYGNFWYPDAPMNGLLGLPGLESLGAPERMFDQLSFHVCLYGVRMATVPCQIYWNQPCNKHNLTWVYSAQDPGYQPISIYFSDDCPVFVRKKVYKIVIAYLHYLSRAYGADCYIIAEPPEDNFDLYREVCLRGRIYASEIWERPYVDLGDSEQDIFKNIRKSSKSHINWARKNISMEYFSGADINSESVPMFYSAYQHVHENIIKKYGDGTTKEIFLHPMLICGNNMGEIAIAKNSEGGIVAMTVTTYANDTAYYSLGGSLPIDNHNIGHFVVYDSILRAKQRNCKKYIMNKYHPGMASQDNFSYYEQAVDRIISILFFKRGFSDSQEFMYVYKVYS